MGRLVVILLVVVGFVLGAAISFYNVSLVTFHYLAGQVELPLIALLIGAFFAGVLVMWLISVARVFGLSRESRRHQRQIRDLEAELRSLRDLPLAQPGAAKTAPSKNA